MNNRYSNHLLGVCNSPLFQLVDEKYRTTDLASGRVRDLRLVYMSSRVHMIFVGGVAKSLNDVDTGFNFHTNFVRF